MGNSGQSAPQGLGETAAVGLQQRSVIQQCERGPEGRVLCPSINCFNLPISASATWTPTRLPGYELPCFTIKPSASRSPQICWNTASSLAVKPHWQVNVTIHDVHISQKLQFLSLSHPPTPWEHILSFTTEHTDLTGININSKRWVLDQGSGNFWRP